jgi:AcrR family transcriptional regulator
MGVSERRAREKEALRQSILDAASQLVVEQGHQSLSIRKIAEKIEYAPSTIYLYFQDKYEILASICVEVFDRLSAKLLELQETEPDTLTMLKKGLRCYIEFGLANPSYYMVTFQTPWPDPPPDHPVAETRSPDEAGVRTFGYLCQAIQKGIDEGIFRNENAHMLGQATWLSIHGLTSGIIWMGQDPHFPWVDRDVLIEGQLDLLIRGLLR